MKYLASSSLSASLLALAFGALSNAQSPETTSSPTMDALLACQDLRGTDDRLACVDERLAALAAAITTGQLVVVERETPQMAETVAEAVVTAQAQVVAFEPWDRFGFEQPRILPPGNEREGVEVSEGITADIADDGRMSAIYGLEVASVSFNDSGRATVRMMNGQVWRQRDTVRVRRVRDRDYEEGVFAEVEGAFMGGYVMRLSHARGRFRVERVR